MHNLLFSINAVAPIFLIVFFGFILKRKNIINDNFTDVSSKMVFKIGLPALLFKDVAETDFRSVFDLRLIFFALGGTLLMFLLLCAISPIFIKDKKTRGAFIHGAFRSNYAILGIPVTYNALGQIGLTKSAILLAFTIPLYNVLAVIVLTINSSERETSRIKDVVFNIAKNPLIIGILLALPFSYFQIELPAIATKTIDYLSSLAIPLALLGMGGSFSFGSIKRNFSESLAASFVKIVASPIIFTLSAYLLGFRGADLGVLFVLFASPTAVSSFIMAKAMDSDSDMAANIVLMTTFGSVLTIFLGIFMLKSTGMI